MALNKVTLITDQSTLLHSDDTQFDQIQSNQINCIRIAFDQIKFHIKLTGSDACGVTAGIFPQSELTRSSVFGRNQDVKLFKL